jgi:hypothetical protein
MVRPYLKKKYLRKRRKGNLVAKIRDIYPLIILEVKTYGEEAGSKK